MNIDITVKKMNNRVKIIEIEVDDNGIFATVIPYKDTKSPKLTSKFNIEGIIYIKIKILKQ